MDQFRDRTVVVTGGASGIGRAVALKFGAAGANVVVGDVREAPKPAARYPEETDVPTHDLIVDRGGTASFQATDVGVAADCEALIDRTHADYGRLDVLVNNAGIAVLGDIRAVSIEDWHRVLDVNLSGTFYCSKFAVPGLVETTGSIVNVASVNAIEGGSGPPYAATKAAIVNLTRDLAVALGPDDVTVNAVCPGFVKTPNQDYLSDDEVQASLEQTVLPRLGEPEDVADAIAFLASDAASWITGEALFVDGGWTAHRGV